MILDIHMPGLAGDELAKLIHATPQWREVPLIAVTGNDDASVRLRIHRAGFHHGFVKPVDPEALVAAIEGCAECGSGLERNVRAGSRSLPSAPVLP